MTRKRMLPKSPAKTKTQNKRSSLRVAKRFLAQTQERDASNRRTQTNLTTEDLTADIIEAAGLIKFNKRMTYSDEGEMLGDNSYGIEVILWEAGEYAGQEWRKFDGDPRGLLRRLKGPG